MEKERFFDNSGHLMPTSDQLLQPCFLNLNWDRSMDHNSQFGSSLSSIVSSPTTGGALASVVLGELIGRSVSVCNSGEISPISRQYQNNNNSTPLNSPPTLNLSFHGNIPISGNLIMPPATHLPLFSADQGFTERAARFSCFNGDGGNYSGPQLGSSDIPIQEPTQLRIEMKPNFGLHPARSEVSNHGQFNSVMESSASEHAVVGGGSNSRKRKAVQSGRAKDAPLSSITRELHKVAEDDNLNAKRDKSSEAMGVTKDDIKPKVEPSSSANSADGDQKLEKDNSFNHPEPPKQDYIHVRARRGQATDSHSLAERVRREKISERMKFLQDLVPGCNKVTGKAVMLDEIINYVQSLQQQVEFLSMKLSTVAPRLDFDVENLLHKDIHQSGESFCRSALPAEIPSSAFPFAPQPSQSAPLQSTLTNGVENHCPVNSLESTLRKTAVVMQLPTFDGFGDFNSQTGGFWDSDLQNVVQMGFAPNQESTFSSSAFNGTLLESHMKVEH